MCLLLMLGAVMNPQSLPSTTKAKLIILYSWKVWRGGEKSGEFTLFEHLAKSLTN